MNENVLLLLFILLLLFELIIVLPGEGDTGRSEGIVPEDNSLCCLSLSCCSFCSFSFSCCSLAKLSAAIFASAARV